MSAVTFRYRALDARGLAASGTLTALDRSEAFRRLQAQGLRPVSLGPARRGRRRRVTVRDLSHFTHQFAVLSEARMPIVDGLSAIAEQESNETLRSVITDISSTVASGQTITQALESHRALFGDAYVETIRAAEASASLPDVLRRLADMLERQQETGRTLRGALTYPACVLASLVLAVVFLLMVVVPRFAGIFRHRGVDLPVPTRIVLGAADLLLSGWPFILLAMAALAMTVRAVLRRPAAREQADALLHRIPFVRDLLRASAVSRFSHLLGICLRSGQTLPASLAMAGRASGRPLLRAQIEHARERISLGARPSDALAACSYLPAFSRRMLGSGEETRELATMCEVVARQHDRDLAHLAKSTSTVLEPLLIAALAGAVLFIALSIFLPMWNMSAVVG
ncbi:MAG: type II secretion system F family protein [Phycisphaeraceae bacterium]|nr:type II secretion system F family protein [Phycisphaeraceae bacterium]